MVTKIKWVWKQVKGAVGLEAAELKADPERPLDLDEAQAMLEEMVESVKERRRAQELRGIARRLRDEAMLVDVAASVAEERAQVLRTARLTELGQSIFPQ